VVLMLSALLPREMLVWAILVVTMIASLVPAVYSYLLWRREARGADS
jgi:ABC-type Mn2+/Zn2+ transport system permease subunit